MRMTQLWTGFIILLLAVQMSAQAQTSVVYWCNSTDTQQLNIVVQKVGNRYLATDISGYTNASRNVYRFVDWDIVGSANQPGGITNFEVEPAQLHVIHTYEIDKSYTVNELYQNVGKASAMAFLWVGGVPLAQTNISPQISEIRESGSWFYFEQNKRLPYFSQRFPAFSLPANKYFHVNRYSVHDTDAGYRSHGVTKTSTTLTPNFFADDLGSPESNFLACTFSYLTGKAGVGSQYDYIFMDQEHWDSNYQTGTIARMGWFMKECQRVNPACKISDWWAGAPYSRGFFYNPGPVYNPAYVAPDYDPAVAYANGDSTFLTPVNMNGQTSTLAEAQSAVSIGVYVNSFYVHQDVPGRSDISRGDFDLLQFIHKTRINKKLASNAGKPNVWFGERVLEAQNGEPQITYKTRATSPAGTFSFVDKLPVAPPMCEALSFFGLFEGDGSYLWDATVGDADEDPNGIFQLAQYCINYNDSRGTWTPDVPGTPIGSAPAAYPPSMIFQPDYYALGAWKYSAIADIVTAGQKVDFQYSTNNGATWYIPPTNGGLVCELATNLGPLVVGAVTSNQIAIAAYHPFQSVTSTVHVIARYQGNQYGFDLRGKRLQIFKGGLTAPILVPPVLSHTPVSVVETAPPWTIRAAATDDIQVVSAVLWWNRNGGAWTSSPMSIAAGQLTGSIAPNSVTNLEQFQYRIDIVDDQGLTASSGALNFIYSMPPVPALLHAGASWKYLTTAAAPVATWKDVGYNDSLWSSGATPAGYGSDTDLLTVVSYGPLTTNRYPTTYFRTTFAASNATSILALNLYARVDDGLAVYLNGAEVQRVNLPGGTLAYNTLASGNASNAPRPWQIFAINPALLVTGQNTLAAEVHQASLTSSDIYFDLQLQPSAVFDVAVPVTPGILRSVQTAAPPWTVTAYTTNSSQVAGMQLLWNRNGGAWTALPMTGSGGNYAASVAPGVFDDGDQFGYQIQTASLLGRITTNGPFGFMYMIPKGVDLLAPESTWKFFATNSAPVSIWNTTGFNDSTWLSGAAPLGYGSEGDAATVVSYGPDPTNKYLAFYARRTFTVTNLAGITELKGYLRADDGVVVYVNGAEGARYSMPAGAVTYATLAAGGAVNPPRPWVSIDISPALLTTGLNTVAVEVHQSGPTSPDTFFDLFLQPGDAMTISHTALSPVQSAGSPWTMSARVNSFVPVTSATLFWGRNYGSMTPVPMSLVAGNYVATISPTGLVDHEQFQYRIEAFNAVGLGVTNGTYGFMYSVESAPSLIAAESDWKYLAQPAAPAMTWNIPAFDDAAWSSGPAPLGYGGGEKLATVMDYGQDPTNKYTTYYFRNTLTVDSAAGVQALDAYCRVDDGVVLYINGVEAGRINMPAGLVAHTTFASSTTFATNPPRPWVRMTVDKGLLVDGVNTIAAEVHQASLTSSDVSFDFYLSPTYQPAVVHTILPSLTTASAPWLVSANVDSYHPLNSVRLWWTKTGGSWTNVLMSGTGVFTGSIAPGAVADHDEFQYRIEVQDGTGQIITNGPYGFMYSLPPAQSLVMPGSGWKYWATNAAPASAWKTVAFNDSSWAAGPSAFGFGGNEHYGTVLGFGPSALDKYLTYYFRRTFSVTGTAALASLKLYFQADDGLVIYLNGQELGRAYMPAGSISYTNLALSGAANAPRPWQTMTVNPALVVTGQNTIAVEVHQSSGVSGDLFMDLYLYATVGGTLDADSDGMPDAWEQMYFGSATAGAGTADADGDGLSNLSEYISGCDPTSVASVPLMRINASTNAPFILGIQTVSNRLYTVETSRTLIAPAWSVLTNLTGNGAYQTFSSPTNSRYYRYRVRLP